MNPRTERAWEDYQNKSGKLEKYRRRGMIIGATTGILGGALLTKGRGLGIPAGGVIGGVAGHHIGKAFEPKGTQKRLDKQTNRFNQMTYRAVRKANSKKQRRFDEIVALAERVRLRQTYRKMKQNSKRRAEKLKSGKLGGIRGRAIYDSFYGSRG